MSRPRLRSAEEVEDERSREDVRGGESDLSELFSGKVTPRTRNKRARGKARKPTETLPGGLKAVADVFAAGKKVEKEIDFKVRFAEQQVKQFCARRFCENFASSGRRPGSTDFAGDKSRFTFIQTARITVTHEKIEALRAMNVNVDDSTELRGIRIDYEVIREHHLETKLRDALEDLGVKRDIIDQIFVPDIQFKETFFDTLDGLVQKSLQPGEELADKLYEVVRILQPAAQIRAPDVPDLDAEQCFRLVEKADISLPEEVEPGLPEEERAA